MGVHLAYRAGVGTVQVTAIGKPATQAPMPTVVPLQRATEGTGKQVMKAQYPEARNHESDALNDREFTRG